MRKNRAIKQSVNLIQVVIDEAAFLKQTGHRRGNKQKGQLAHRHSGRLKTNVNLEHEIIVDLTLYMDVTLFILRQAQVVH